MLNFKNINDKTVDIFNNISKTFNAISQKFSMKFQSQIVASGEEVDNLRHGLSLQLKVHIIRLCTIQAEQVRPKVRQIFSSCNKSGIL